MAVVSGGEGVVRVDVLLLQAVGGGCGGGAAAAAVCPACGKAFQGRNRRQNLSHHLLTHTGTRPFPCPNCSYRATQKAHLKRHLERRHGNGQTDLRLLASSSGPGMNVENALGAHPHSQGVVVGSVAVEREAIDQQFTPHVLVREGAAGGEVSLPAHHTPRPSMLPVSLGMEGPPSADWLLKFPN